MSRIKLVLLLVLFGFSVQTYGQTNRGTTTRQSNTTTQRSQANAQQATAAPAPATPPTPYSGSPSARPIPASDVMFRRTLWRVVLLDERQNKPMFSENRWITKVIIDAVKKGELTAYKNDSLLTPLSLNEFNANMVAPGQEQETEDERIARLEDERRACEINRRMGRPCNTASSGNGMLTLNPQEIKKLILKEDAIFDKKRSRMYYDIQALSLTVRDEKGLDKTIGSFAYKDLVKVFKNHPNEAIWYNGQNNATHINLANAFDLRLFSSYIQKISNLDDQNLESIHGGSKQAILASQRAMEELIEFESGLWSY